MAASASQIRAKAKVYAEVLLEAAQASDAVFAVANEFDELVATVRGSKELRTALADPRLSGQAKKSIVEEVFAGFSTELLEVFAVMVEREDLPVLSRAFEAYMALAEEALGAVIIDVTTVLPLDDALRKQIKDKYSTEFKDEVLLREHIDPSLIGGIVLSNHGKRIDASVVSQLENARRVLSRT